MPKKLTTNSVTGEYELPGPGPELKQVFFTDEPTGGGFTREIPYRGHALKILEVPLDLWDGLEEQQKALYTAIEAAKGEDAQFAARTALHEFYDTVLDTYLKGWTIPGTDGEPRAFTPESRRKLFLGFKVEIYDAIGIASNVGRNIAGF